jgi:hypothetical protein
VSQPELDNRCATGERHTRREASGTGGGISGEGRQHRALASLAVFWALAAYQAVGAALHSSWPAPPEVPTAAQVHDARTAAWIAAVVAVAPLASGLLLAGRWRMYEWAVAFGVLLLFAVLGSGLLIALAAD